MFISSFITIKKPFLDRVTYCSSCCCFNISSLPLFVDVVVVVVVVAVVVVVIR